MNMDTIFGGSVAVVAPKETSAEQEIKTQELLELCLEWERVGSSITCNPPVVNTDVDYLCLVTDINAFAEDAVRRGFDFAGSIINNGSTEITSESIESEDFEFVSFRLGNNNLIAVEKDVFFDRFMLATRLATRFNLLKKEDRVALFQGILYGNG